MGYIWNLFVRLEDLNMLTTALVFVLTFLLVFYITRRRPNVPPGPPLFPIIGNIPSLAGGDMFETLANLRRTYGDVFGLYIGNELTVFLNGYTTIHDALVKKGSEFGKRPLIGLYKLGTLKKAAFVFANGRTLKKSKAFLLKQFQELCYSDRGKYIEEIVYKEVDHIYEHEKVVDIEDFMTVCFANVMLALLCKRRADLNDKNLRELLEIISLGAKEFTRVSLLLDCFPFLCHVPFDIIGVKAFVKREIRGFSVLAKLMKESTLTKNDDVSCIVDRYREEIDRCDTDTDTAFTESQLLSFVREIIGAGSETSSTVIRWIILFLIRHPHIQQKMFLEIVDKLGPTNKPTWNDRSKLPYVQAVILEGLRKRTPAPLAIPHTVSRDFVFHGYLIPKNTSVMVNIDSCMKDPTAWKEPDKFLPERFLNEDETDILVPEEFIPFSLGNRSCPGESLARMELFLFLTCLVQRFEFQPINEDSLPSVNGHLGLTWSPEPFLVKMIKRT